MLFFKSNNYKKKGRYFMDALITEAKNGDKEAFVRLIRMNKQSLYKTAWIYLRDEQDIADPCKIQSYPAMKIYRD